MHPDRTITIPAQFVGQPDAELRIVTADGEEASMSLVLGGRILALGQGFRVARVGPHTWLDMPEEQVACMFGAFLADAFESSKGDGWPVLTDEASEWTEALAIMEYDAQDAR